jgi:glycosyltransferase involved in cell wall biosynthesis
MARRETLLLNGATSGLSSFALVNRRLAAGLERAGYEVWAGDAEAFADRAELPDVSLTHGHPYDARHAPGRVNVFFLQYDYARFLRADRALRDGLNARFDLCVVPSRFVRDACLASGVAIPLAVCPLGVDAREFHPEAVPAPLATRKRFKIVFVGGPSERKGVDVLVAAFRAAFTAADDAALVLKTNGYDHVVPALAALLAAGDGGGPAIVHEHGGVASVAGYYAAASVGAFPFRGEAFALPILECLATGTPVIVTRGGGPADYCTADNAMFVRARARTVDGKRQLEPDVGDLARLLRRAYEQRAAPRDPARIRATVAAFTWERTIATLAEAIASVVPTPAAGSRVAATTTARDPVVVHAFGELGATSWKKVARHVDTALHARFATSSRDARTRVRDDARPRVVVGAAGFALEHFAAARRADGGVRLVLISGSGPYETVRALTNSERVACGLAPVPSPPLERWRHRLEEGLAGTLVVHSAASARAYAAAGRSAERLAIVPLAFDARRHATRRPREPGRSLRFVFLATDPFRKGLRVLLEAWDALRPRGAELHCFTNTEALASRALLKILVRHPTITVRPLVPHAAVARVLDDADCQVLPSFEDGFALAVAEGMARGLPAIVSDATGIAELLTSGEDGLVVEAGAVGALRDAIGRVCDDPPALARMGAAARATARRRPWSAFERDIGALVASRLAGEGP